MGMGASGTIREYASFDDIPEDEVLVDHTVIDEVKQLNNQCRRVYYSLVRKGMDAQQALKKAHESLPA